MHHNTNTWAEFSAWKTQLADQRASLFLSRTIGEKH